MFGPYDEKQLLNKLGLRELPAIGSYCEWSRVLQSGENGYRLSAMLARPDDDQLEFELDKGAAGHINITVGEHGGELFDLDADSTEAFDVFLEEMRGMELEEPFQRQID